LASTIATDFVGSLWSGWGSLEKKAGHMTITLLSITFGVSMPN
jgi:hypothetical protein